MTDFLDGLDENDVAVNYYPRQPGDPLHRQHERPETREEWLNWRMLARRWNRVQRASWEPWRVSAYNDWMAYPPDPINEVPLSYRLNQLKQLRRAIEDGDLPF